MAESAVLVPAPLSSLFSPKLLDVSGCPRKDPAKIGALGGGFGLAEGVYTAVQLEGNQPDKLTIRVNGETSGFPPTAAAIRILRERKDIHGAIAIDHKMSVPIGVGFGTSAAAAVGAALALCAAAEKPITVQHAATIAHTVELQCRTGLNSELGIIQGGLTLVIKEGAPGYGRTDSIPLPRQATIVVATLGPVDKTRVLGDYTKLKRIEKIGDAYMERILSEPTPEAFLQSARDFAVEADFCRGEIRRMIKFIERQDIIGAAQNMVGNAVHALTHRDKAQELAAALETKFPHTTVTVSSIACGVTTPRPRETRKQRDRSTNTDRKRSPQISTPT